MCSVRYWLWSLLLALLLVGCGKSDGPGNQAPTTGLASAPVPFKERRVAIVYSDASAKNYFDEFSFGQLYTAMQHQAMQAGIPYDLIEEADLVNAGTLAKYDALIIPVMSHVERATRNQIINALLAAQKNGLAIVTSSEFMTYDKDNQPFSNAYSAMIDLLGLTPKTYQVGVATQLSVASNNHAITRRYGPNELIDEYDQAWFAEFSPVDPSQATTLVTAKADNQDHSALQVLERPGRVVHFANDAFLADNNMLWSAIRWALYGDIAPVSLLPSRSPSLFIARNDMDQAMVAAELDENEIPLLDIIREWKRDYNFVGSYYIDIGDKPNQGYYTDWSVSKPLYADYLALDNEFGTHSWTHPHHTSLLSDAELDYEFNQSAREISTQLGINVIGGAVPGNPENLNVVKKLDQWFEYFSGRSITGATGYRSGYGFLSPDYKMRYFSLNMTPDFGLIDFRNFTPTQSEQIWKEEFDAIEAHAEMPVMHWLWHDYGPTAQAETGRYSKAMFEDTIDYAFNAGSEFATLADYHSRLNSFETASFSTGLHGSIRARVEGVGMGQFALKMEQGQNIASVANWYAYSDDAVYVPDNGGDFAITPGNNAADVTRIVELPMRARLMQVVGNANELDFSFEGQGQVSIELSAAMQNNFRVSGADSFTRDGNILVLNFDTTNSHIASVKAINAVNSPPVSIAKSVITSYSAPAAIALFATDPNSDALSYTIVDGPSNGVLSGVAPNLVYMPNDGFSGIDTFTYTASDGTLTGAVSTITVSVDTPATANSAPVANRAVYNAVKEQSLGIVLSGADNEGQGLQFAVVSQPENGMLIGTAPNLLYQADAGFTGKDVFTFQVSDGFKTSAVEEVIVHVSEQPLPSNGTVSNASTGFTLDGQLNDWRAISPFGIDPQDVGSSSGNDWKQAWMAHNSSTFFVAFEQYQNTSLDWRSQLYIDSDTQRTTGFNGFANEYPIGADYLIEGNTILKYTGTGGNWSWELSGTLSGVAAGNVVEMGIPRARLGNPMNLNLFFVSINTDSAYDYYPDDANNVDAIQYTRQFSYSINANTNVTNAAPVANSMVTNTTNNAELSIQLSGYDINNDSLSYSLGSQPASGTLTGTPPNVRYTPNGGFVGKDSFTFTVNDGSLPSNSGTVSINVVSPPALDSIPVAHNKSISVLSNASAAVTLSGSDYDGSALGYTVVNNPMNGSLSGQIPQLVYTPNNGFTGIDQFTYRVNDGILDSELATVRITVGSGAINVPPIANNQSLVTAFETAIGLTLSGTDPDGDALTYTIKRQPRAGSLAGTPPNMTYTPADAAVGIDTFTFAVNDGSVDSTDATVSIEVKAPILANQAPIAIGQVLDTGINTSVNVQLSGTDADNNQLSFSVTEQPAGGTLSGSAPNLVYSPNNNFTGVDRMKFVVSDGALTSNAAIVTINVAGNPNGIRSNQVASMTIDGEIADWVGLNPFANDPDDVFGVNNPLNWMAMAMAHDTGNIYFMFRNDGPFSLSWGHAIRIDVDGNSSTGFKGFDNAAPIGADYLIEGNNIHAYTGAGSDWSWSYVGTATSALQTDTLEFAVPRSMLGNPTNLQVYLQASNEPFGGTAVDYYPDKAIDPDAPLAERVMRYSTGL